MFRDPNHYIIEKLLRDFKMNLDQFRGRLLASEKKKITETFKRRKNHENHQLGVGGGECIRSSTD